MQSGNDAGRCCAGSGSWGGGDLARRGARRDARLVRGRVESDGIGPALAAGPVIAGSSIGSVIAGSSIGPVIAGSSIGPVIAGGGNRGSRCPDLRLPGFGVEWLGTRPRPGFVRGPAAAPPTRGGRRRLGMPPAAEAAPGRAGTDSIDPTAQATRILRSDLRRRR